MEKDSNVVRVLACIPNEGHTQVEAYANRLENYFYLGTLQERGIQENRSPRFEFHIVTLGRIFTPIAREEAARLCVEQGFDYLYMIDDDMICPNDLFERLYAHNVDVIAPLAFTRNFPHHPVIYDVKEDWDPVSKSHYFINHFIDDYPRDQLVECDAVGFGAILIKGSVLRGMPRPWFQSTCGSGEDIYFCHQAGKSGFRIFMDTATKLGHLGHPTEVTEQYVEKVRKEFDYSDPLSLSSQKTVAAGESLLVLGQ